MQIEGWAITSGVVLFTALVNYVAFRTSAGKDIASLTKRADDHSARITKVKEDVEDCVNKKDCEERRGEFSENLREIKDTVIRLEQKFDKYILNGRK